MQFLLLFFSPTVPWATTYLTELMVTSILPPSLPSGRSQKVSDMSCGDSSLTLEWRWVVWGMAGRPTEIDKHWQECNDELSSLIARFMGQTRGPSGADRTQVGPMLAPWTLLSGFGSGNGLVSSRQSAITWGSVGHDRWRVGGPSIKNIFSTEHWTKVSN